MAVGRCSGVATLHDQLLEATLQHLAELRSQGVRLVDVRPETLAALTRTGPTPAVPHRPGPSARTAPSSPAPAPEVFGGRSPAPPRPAAEPRPPLPAVALSTSTRTPGLPELLAGAPLTPADRETAMAELRERARICEQCPPLVKSRTQVVFGVGSLEAELMFVGEAPGADEDRLGEPFVGRAGQLLTKIIVAMGLTRETVYIANILKCRPDLPPGSRGNRPPRPEEMDTCKPWLLRQIGIIRPRVMVALGNTAVQGLLNVQTTMGSVRGRWQDFHGIPVMPTFHPSYLLRSEDGPDRGFTEKRKTWTDMLQVLERLGRPISEKMRGYFLKPPS